MNRFQQVGLLTVTGLLALQTVGCGGQHTSVATTTPQTEQTIANASPNTTTNVTTSATASTTTTITLANFKKILTNSEKLPQAVSYLKKNISKVTPQTGTQLVLALENAQNKYITNWTDKYTESMQKKLMNMYNLNPNDDIDDMIKRTKDQSLKTLLTNTRNSGYTIINVEGYYMPIIDYDQYDAYDDHVTKDIDAYIDIMADESDHPAIMDAGLVIDWDDLLERTLDMEQFILKYPNSNRAKIIKQNYEYAIHTVFYGVDNTLLFDQSNKKIDPTAKKQYLEVLNDDDTVEDYPSSSLLSDLHGFMDLAAQSNYKMTSKLDAYREQVAPLSL